MTIRILYEYQGRQHTFERAAAPVIIGRPNEGVDVDLDLTPDLAVSRPHARIWLEGGECWIEDLGSTRGTLISGKDIKGQGKKQVRPDEKIQIGSTTLHVEITGGEPAEEPARDPTANIAPDPSFPEAHVEIGQTIAPNAPAIAIKAPANSDISRRLALLYELPLQFAEQPGLESLLQRIVEQLVGIIPGAARGAVLLRPRGSNALLLKAHVPLGETRYQHDACAKSDGKARRVHLAEGGRNHAEHGGVLVHVRDVRAGPVERRGSWRHLCR